MRGSMNVSSKGQAMPETANYMQLCFAAAPMLRSVGSRWQTGWRSYARFIDRSVNDPSVNDQF